MITRLIFFYGRKYIGLNANVRFGSKADPLPLLLSRTSGAIKPKPRPPFQYCTTPLFSLAISASSFGLPRENGLAD